ncbi:MAG: multifunctional CCA addition/repair protein [Sedimenticola sp.]|nr:multifunctional CCA addition/repair protein [Sedimenticola sp.]
MRRYLVGGAVRDRLLGLDESDHDWLVTGVTGEQLVGAGYRQVGQDFSVFLHPETAEEYALPRGVKTDTGEREQVCDDLIQRDLTINALALSPEDELIDPLNGQRDLAERILRHTPTFRQDPIRVLRLARLAARLSPLGFRVAGETRTMIHNMVRLNELNALVPERVWSEIMRALEGDSPVIFFRTLRDLQALKVIMPSLDRLFGVPQPEKHHPEIDTGIHSFMVLEQATLLRKDPETRLAALLHDLGKGITHPDQWPSHHGHEQRGAKLVDALCRSLRIPNRFRDLSRLVAEFHTHCHRALELKPSTLVKLLLSLDALRRPERLEQFLAACKADARGRTGFETIDYPQADYCRAAQRAAAGIDTAKIARLNNNPQQIADAIFQARSRAVAGINKA